MEGKEMVLELMRMMSEHSKTRAEHDEFYELAEKFGFCTPWCHLEKHCESCEKNQTCEK
jgi:hypothetical protein